MAILRTKVCVGNSNNFNSAIENKLVDAFDFVFFKDTGEMYFLTADMEKILMSSKRQVSFVDTLPSDSKQNILYITDDGLYRWDEQKAQYKEIVSVKGILEGIQENEYNTSLLSTKIDKIVFNFNEHINNTSIHMDEQKNKKLELSYNHSLSTHAPLDAEKNVITSIKVNGETLEVKDNRSVNISIPTHLSQFTNDLRFQTTDTKYSLSKTENKIVMSGTDGTESSIDIDSHVLSGDGNTIILTSGNKTSEYTIPCVSQNNDGIMSSQDKTKLDGIEYGANNYILPKASDQVMGGVILGRNIHVDKQNESIYVEEGSLYRKGIVQLSDEINDSCDKAVTPRAVKEKLNSLHLIPDEKLDNESTNTLQNKVITSEICRLDEKIQKLIDDLAALTNGSIKNITDEIDRINETLRILNGDESVENSIDNKIKVRIDSIIDGAPEAFDALKEISDWINTDGEAAYQLVDTVNENIRDIENLKLKNDDLQSQIDNCVLSVNQIGTIEDYSIDTLF